ncbi:zinc ribbon domain-containing protein [Geobacillus sp. CAMR5420]|uniref:zinc ribbon domain-containing protein n=1 Tax=Geobacillus sp. CAMR5420 TaxID=1482739 RepID=UPI0024103EC4|nr:zinc ribbon domain-containing protein [Geobacillus sp. CAMR5420]
MCSCCWHRQVEMKSLGICECMCPNGGAEHDRDHNAARNILNEGFRLLSLQGSRTVGCTGMAW